MQKRLKLANVSPALIAAYRNGEMTLQHIMAFAVTDDHEAQERVWNELSDWQKDDPVIIRDMLTEDDVTLPEHQVFIIPVRLDKCEPKYSALREINWIDLFPDWRRGVTNLVRSIHAGR